MKRAILIGVGSLLLLGLALTGCQPTDSTGPLVVLIDNDEGPITPANFNTFIGYWMIGYVYDPLFVRDPDLTPVPALATEATASEDGLTWIIKLREGVKWHDGEAFDADDGGKSELA